MPMDTSTVRTYEQYLCVSPSSMDKQYSSPISILPALHIVSQLYPLKSIDDYFAIGEKLRISDYECLLYASTVPLRLRSKLSFFNY